MLNFVSNAVPAVVAQFLILDKMAILFKAAVDVAQFIQAMFRQAAFEICKQNALDFDWATDDVVDMLFGFHEAVDQYVKTVLLPSMIDGTILLDLLQ